MTRHSEATSPRVCFARAFAAAVASALMVAGTAEAADSSLRFHGHGVNDIDRVKIAIDDPERPADVGGDFTLEWWMKATLAENGAPACTTGNDNWITGNIMFDRDVYGAGDFGDYGVSLRGGRIAFGVADGSSGEGICGATNVADGVWHHLAVTRDAASGDVAIWVDGQSDGPGGSGPTGGISYRDGRPTPFDNDPFLVIGAEKHDAGSSFPSYSGWIDEVRLSTSMRYAGSFTPPAAPFVTDADTVALYHFDEGVGNAVGDSSGAAGGPSDGMRRFGGSAPAGPEWSGDTPFASNPTPTPTGPTPMPTETVTPAPVPSCGEMPLSGCRTPAVAAKAAVQWKDRTPDDGDRLAWKWLKGAVTPKSDFGDPLATTSHRLCVFDATGNVASAAIPSGGTCAGRPCWRESGSGFRYVDKELSPDGIAKLTLTQGLTSGKAKIILKGKGSFLPDASLATLASPVTVQLISSGGVCWGAVYGFPPALKNLPTEFKDRAD